MEGDMPGGVREATYLNDHKHKVAKNKEEEIRLIDHSGAEGVIVLTNKIYLSIFISVYNL